MTVPYLHDERAFSAAEPDIDVEVFHTLAPAVIVSLELREVQPYPCQPVLESSHINNANGFSRQNSRPLCFMASMISDVIVFPALLGSHGDMIPSMWLIVARIIIVDLITKQLTSLTVQN